MALGLSSFHLKLIAVITMIIDHVGMLMFPGDMVFRAIGRIAFPIYCFLIVEGFYHTSDVRKYMKRLAIFALISEVPFNLLVSGSIFSIEYQNVFITLLIGLLTIYGINSTLNMMLKSVMLVAGVLVAIALMTDYSFYGVILIYTFYNLRERRMYACVVMAIASFLVSNIQGTAILAVIPILMYNGEKGPAFADNKMWKYAFYMFYPVHMVLLYIVTGCLIKS